MCNFTAQNFRDDLFFILFHIISAFYSASGASIYHLFTVLYFDGIYNKV